MKIWKLANINENSKDWAANICSGNIIYVIVRAENEGEARSLASEKLTKASIRKEGESSIGSPWLKLTDTSCHPIDDVEFSLEGGPEILKIETT